MQSAVEVGEWDKMKVSLRLGVSSFSSTGGRRRVGRKVRQAKLRVTVEGSGRGCEEGNEGGRAARCSADGVS